MELATAREGEPMPLTPEQKRKTRYLYPNYVGLKITIEYNIESDLVVDALAKEYPTERRKPGPKSRTEKELMNMKALLEKGWTFNKVAKKYGLKRGDNVYQLLRRAGMLPER